MTFSEIEKMLEFISYISSLEISNIFTEEERPSLHDKNYLNAPSIKLSKGAFHEKKEKNIKVNSGSPARKRKHKKGKSAKGRRRVRRSQNTEQLNLRISPETLDRFTKLADKENVIFGEMLVHLIDKYEGK